jgi:hypothetical protein
MTAYLKRLLDATDHGADLMCLGIFCGFMVFVASIITFLALFAAHTFHPAWAFDARGFGESMLGLGAMYASVLAATTAAYRIRGPVTQTNAGGASA